MTEQVQPRLSLVVPTMGKNNITLRLFDTLVTGAAPGLLAQTELIVFLNADPRTKVDVSAIEKCLETHRHRFLSCRFVRADKFHLTAEESAYAAVAYATGEYLWIAGDKRIFLPEGLAQLAAYLEAPQTPCAYFNSVWQTSDGYTNVHPSTHFSKSIATMPYKTFVQGNGINFIATSMGAWVFRRELLDRDVWAHIIKNCGPHFSHVATLLKTLGKTEILYHAVYLYISEAKAYHDGDANEWSDYSKLAGTYRYYAWTFGLVRQFQYLIDQGSYSYADIRRSMCSEGIQLSRQIDEIYNHFILQIQVGWLIDKERVTQGEFGEILTFLSRVCPERGIVNGMMRRLYAASLDKKVSDFVLDVREVQRAVAMDHQELRFATLVVGQVGDCFIRLHPRGYLLSRVRDNEDFMLAYKLADPPAQHKRWTIISDSELARLRYETKAKHIGALFPVHVRRPERKISGALKQRPRLLVRKVYNGLGGARLLSYLPKGLVVHLWRHLF